MREEQEDYCSRQGHHSEDPDVCGVLVCASCGGHVTERRIGKDDIRGFSRSGENLFLDPPSPDENKSEGHEELTPAQGIREDQELVIREATRIISYHQRQHESRHLGARRRLIQPDMSPESTGFPSPNSVSAREYVKAQSKCGDVSAIALSESMEDGEAVSQEAVYTSRDTYTVCSAVKASTEIRHRYGGEWGWVGGRRRRRERERCCNPCLFSLCPPSLPVVPLCSPSLCLCPNLPHSFSRPLHLPLPPFLQSYSSVEGGSQEFSLCLQVRRSLHHFLSHSCLFLFFSDRRVLRLT